MTETVLTTVFTRRRRLVFETRRPPVGLPREPERPADTRWIDKAKSLPDLRFDKVQALRNAIASGRYDVDARLSAVLDDLSRDVCSVTEPT